MRGETIAVPARTLATPRAAPKAFARVVVHEDPAAIAEAWATLEATPSTIYQTRAWVLPWVASLGRRAGIKPRFVLALAHDDRPVALLCLGLVRHGPVKLATWLGGKDANLNLPLLADHTTWTEADIRALLREAAHACGEPRPDVFVLSNQLFAWQGRANPFARLPHLVSPSAAYGTRLPRDADALFARQLSRETRKKLRKKEDRLARVGPVMHCVAADGATKTRILDAFLRQKIERLRRQGIGSEFDTPEMQAFIAAASRPDGDGIELHALCAGARIVAVYGGAAHQGQWSGMFNSFDTDEDIAKSSPGDLLLMRIVAKACADGLTGFDLGIGEARYKAALCDERIALFDLVFPISPKGALYAQAFRTWRRAKRLVKASPRLSAIVKRVRARLHAGSDAADP